MTKPPDPASDEMSFLDHLEVLRWHLVRMASALLVAAVFAFVAKQFVFDRILLGPMQSDFITYRALCSLSGRLSDWFPNMFSHGTVCLGQNLPALINLTMAGQFTAHILVSLVSGVIIAFPYLIWEVWRFIKPGLTEKEGRFARGFVISTTILFLAGSMFAYFVICPLSINFFLNYQVSESVLNNPTLETYTSLVTTIVLACGAVFELPVLVYFLTRLGIVNASMLRGFRRHAIVGALILSAIITPPDVFSQILVSIPILILYQFSIWVSRMVEKSRA